MILTLRKGVDLLSCMECVHSAAVEACCFCMWRRAGTSCSCRLRPRELCAEVYQGANAAEKKRCPMSIKSREEKKREKDSHRDRRTSLVGGHFHVEPSSSILIHAAPRTCCGFKGPKQQQHQISRGARDTPPRGRRHFKRSQQK